MAHLSINYLVYCHQFILVFTFFQLWILSASIGRGRTLEKREKSYNTGVKLSTAIFHPRSRIFLSWLMNIPFSIDYFWEFVIFRQGPVKDFPNLLTSVLRSLLRLQGLQRSRRYAYCHQAKERITQTVEGGEQKMQQKTDSHGYWSLSKFLKYKATKRIAPLPEWHNSQSQATRMSIPAFSQVCLTLLGNHFYSWVGKGTKRVRFMYLANDTSSCSTRKFANVDPKPTALPLSLPRPPKKEWELSNLLGLRCLMKVARGS